MNIEPASETIKNPPEQFAGDVWVDMVAVPHVPEQRGVVAKVRFTPGARTAWHSHARGQYLHVTAEEHWHASADGTFMEHRAILENADDPAATTVWGEHITDEEYHGRR